MARGRAASSFLHHPVEERPDLEQPEETAEVIPNHRCLRPSGHARFAGGFAAARIDAALIASNPPLSAQFTDVTDVHLGSNSPGNTRPLRRRPLACAMHAVIGVTHAVTNDVTQSTSDAVGISWQALGELVRGHRASLGGEVPPGPDPRPWRARCNPMVEGTLGPLSEPEARAGGGPDAWATT